MSGPDSVRVLERCDLCAPCVFIIRYKLYVLRYTLLVRLNTLWPVRACRH